MMPPPGIVSLPGAEKTAAPGPVWIVVFTGNSGLTHYSFCLAGALSAAGQDVNLITNKNFDLGDFPASFPVTKVFGRSRWYPAAILRYWLLYRRQRPAVVHYQAFLKFPALEAILLKLQQRRGSRVVLTAHDWLPHNPRFYHRTLFRLVYRIPDRIIVHSRAGKEFLTGKLGVKAAKTAIVPHGNYGFFNTDPALSREQARERLGLEPERFWFLFFGRIDPHKGLDVALRALARINSEKDDVQAGLLIAGKPAGDMEPYTRLIDELKLNDSIILHSRHIPVSEIQVYFKAADAVVMPYRESSTSGIAHVAMGFEKPVVASDVGGIAEVVEDGVTGMLVPPEDEARLAQAMGYLARNPESRRRLAAGWAGVRESYSWESIARRTLKIYASLTGGAR